MFYDMTWLERILFLKRIKGSGNPMHEATSTSDSFATDVVAPLKSLKVTLEPIQSGSGTPSPDNVRPISGHTEVVTEVCGKNLLDVSTAYKFIGYNAAAGTDLSPQIADYQWEENGDTFNIYLRDWRQASFISKKLPLGNVKLTLENVTGLLRCSVYVCDENFTINRLLVNYNPIDVGTNVEINTTFAGTDAYLAVYLGGHDQDASLSKPRIYVGENASDTDYEPYQGTSYTTTLGRTVYSGTLDVVSGELTITDGYIASYNGEALPSTWISDRDVYASGTTPTIGAQVVYELATPQTYQLTPQQINSLIGQNNIITEDGVEVSEVVYMTRLVGSPQTEDEPAEEIVEESGEVGEDG